MIPLPTPVKGGREEVRRHAQVCACFGKGRDERAQKPLSGTSPVRRVERGSVRPTWEDPIAGMIREVVGVTQGQASCRQGVSQLERGTKGVYKAAAAAVRRGEFSVSGRVSTQRAEGQHSGLEASVDL